MTNLSAGMELNAISALQTAAKAKVAERGARKTVLSCARICHVEMITAVKLLRVPVRKAIGHVIRDCLPTE
jgi:hypothetical protein